MGGRFRHLLEEGGVETGGGSRIGVWWGGGGGGGLPDLANFPSGKHKGFVKY